MKRFIFIFTILILLIWLLIGGVWYAIRSERVQGWLVNYATERLSERLNADVSIDHLYWDLPSHLTVTGLYVSDDQRDTLLYVPSLRAQWDVLAMRDGILAFPSISLTQPYIRFVQDSASTNADFLRTLFTGNAQPMPYVVDLQDIAIHQAYIHYIHRPSNRDIMVKGLTTEWSLMMDPKASEPIAKVHHVTIKASTSGVDGFIQTQLHGSLDSIYADQIQLVYRNQNIFRGHVQVIHPTHQDSLYAHITCDDLSANAVTAYGLASDILRRPLAPPQALRQLGQLHYQGQLTFHNQHLSVLGALRTALGTVQTDVTVDTTLNYTLRASSRSLRLSRFVENMQLPPLQASVTAEGTYDAQQPLQMAFAASVQAQSPQLDCDIHAEGTMADSLTMDITMALPALVTDRLFGTDSVNRLSVNTNMTAHWQAPLNTNLITHAIGYLHLDTISLMGHHHQLVIPYADITASYDSLHLLIIESPVLNADIAGSMPWNMVPGAMLRYAHQVLPSLVPTYATPPCGQQLQLHAECNSLTELLQVFTSSPMVIPDTLVMDGYINDLDSVYDFAAHVPVIHSGNFSYDSIALSLTNVTPDRSMTFHIQTNQHIREQDSTRLQIDSLTYMVDITAQQDTMLLSFLFTPMDSLDMNLDVACVAAFARDEDNNLRMHTHILPTRFDLGTKVWSMEESDITYTAADTTWLINHMRLYTADQSIAVHGAISNNPADTVKIDLQDIQLGYFLSATAVLNAVDIQGAVSGWVHLFRKEDRTQFEAAVSMPHGYINGADLGRVSATATLDSVSNHIIIDGLAQRDSMLVATVHGRVKNDPVYWELYIDANGAPLSLINHWTNGILDNINGQGYGLIHVFGWKLHTFVTAQVLAKDAHITVPFTGCTYSLTDTIVLDTTSISFSNIRLYDKDGHSAILDGAVTHDNFQDIRFDLNIRCHNLLGFDMPKLEDQMYYGKAYASGKVHIYGGQEVNVDVDAMATEGTDFYLTTTTASSATNSDFIIFRSANQPMVEDTLEAEVTPAVIVPTTPVHLRFNIDLTPQAKVHLLMNSHNGDGLVGRGEGSIALSMNTNTGDIQLLGSIRLQSGEFTYSIANIVRREFMIADGSTVTWSGNPLNPELDVTARYRCTASLKDLFGTDASTITSRSSIPVDCVIKMQGNFDDPTFSFGIEFPQTEESVSAQIYAVINTESMLMRQVIYLLAFNRFFTPEYIRTATSGGGSGEAYSLLSSTVTGQINSWLSKLTDVVSFGFNMRSDNMQANSEYEYEANIQLQPVDRLTINGNVGYRYNDLSNRPFFGDADIEYELTKNGKLRAKVYTHSVDKYSMRQANMQEGVGLIFRHDFNPGDAKRRRAIRQQLREQRQSAKVQSQSPKK
ncbi:MAG: translocation/assembly module TamB [Paludibacteraceae bacterium]|nr:translocation/assembly module TamB [Paludibacteraceae bacterium]